MSRSIVLSSLILNLCVWCLSNCNCLPISLCTSLSIIIICLQLSTSMSAYLPVLLSVYLSIAPAVSVTVTVSVAVFVSVSCSVCSASSDEAMNAWRAFQCLSHRPLVTRVNIEPSAQPTDQPPTHPTTHRTIRVASSFDRLSHRWTDWGSVRQTTDTHTHTVCTDTITPKQAKNAAHIKKDTHAKAREWDTQRNRDRHRQTDTDRERSGGWHLVFVYWRTCVIAIIMYSAIYVVANWSLRLRWWVDDQWWRRCRLRPR